MSSLPVISSTEIIIKALCINEVIDRKGKAADVLWLGTSLFEENGHPVPNLKLDPFPKCSLRVDERAVLDPTGNRMIA